MTHDAHVVAGRPVAGSGRQLATASEKLMPAMTMKMVGQQHVHGSPLVPQHAVALSTARTGKDTVRVYRVGNSYYYVTTHPDGTVSYAVVQLPSSVQPASASSLPFHLGTVGSALGAVVRGLAGLMRTGGGGFGNRIVPGFPTMLLLFGLALAGSGAWLRRRGHPLSAEV